MPTQSTLTADDKLKVKSAILSSSNKILTASVARIYYAHPNPRKWAYSGHQGGLVFARDNTRGAYFFRMVDLDGTRGVVWEHELYAGFEYFPDRPFFHSFAGDDCNIGFVFTDESEAKVFLKKVIQRKDIDSSKSSTSKKQKTSSSSKRIDKSRISAPQEGSFKHLGHMGYDSEKGFTSTGVDPSWSSLLGTLGDLGIDNSIIAKDMDFIKDFVRNAQMKEQQQQKISGGEKKVKPPPPPAPKRGSHLPPASSVAPVGPPPRPAQPPPNRNSRAPQSPPPPPPTLRNPAAAPVPPPPPPPPAVRGGPPAAPVRAAPTISIPPPPPVPPTRTTNAPPAPPPPPPPPMGSIAPPPPPPPPPMGGAPPPPPAPPATSGGGPPQGIPPAQTGRSDLLASIAGRGVHSLKKVDPGETRVKSGAPVGRVVGDDAEPSPSTSGGGGGGTSTSTSMSTSTSGGGGGDLTSALAAALLERNKKLADSDDEEEEEEDDWD